MYWGRFISKFALKEHKVVLFAFVVTRMVARTCFAWTYHVVPILCTLSLLCLSSKKRCTWATIIKKLYLIVLHLLREIHINWFPNILFTAMPHRIRMISYMILLWYQYLLFNTWILVTLHMSLCFDSASTQSKSIICLCQIIALRTDWELS